MTGERYYVVTLRQLEDHKIPYKGKFGINKAEHDSLLDDPNILRVRTNKYGDIHILVYQARLFSGGPQWERCDTHDMRDWEGKTWFGDQLTQEEWETREQRLRDLLPELQDITGLVEEQRRKAKLEAERERVKRERELDKKREYMEYRRRCELEDSVRRAREHYDPDKAALSTPAHRENSKLWRRAEHLARERKVHITANATTYANWAGQWSYAVLLPGYKDYAITSRHCVMYSQAPYARNYRPSVKGERECIQRLIRYLETVDDEELFAD